jgi:hypothetical protein
MIEILIGIGRCYGMEMSVENKYEVCPESKIHHM